MKYRLIEDVSGARAKELYFDVHQNAQRLSKRCDVMIVSDHGILPDTAEHTKHAYLGCTREVKAESVVDVKKDIRRIMEEKIVEPSER